MKVRRKSIRVRNDMPHLSLVLYIWGPGSEVRGLILPQLRRGRERSTV